MGRLKTIPQRLKSAPSRLAPRTTADRQAKRALPTNCAAWRAIRADVLAEQPLCRHCEQANRVTVATEVDHVDGNDSNNDRANLQGLCKPCHSRKTAAENQGFGNPRSS